MHVVVYEGPGARRMSPQARLELIEAMLQAGWCVARVDCLCAAPGEDAGPSVIVALFEQQARDAIAAGGAGGTTAIDLDGLDLQTVCSRVAGILGREQTAWSAWFPAVDSAACTDCRQCVDFCLFGVYEVDESGAVRVRHPEKCKPGCPACARICPTGAIIFPKHESSPINGRAGDGPQRPVDLKAALEGDVYATLRSRQGDTPRRLNRPDRDKALAEREACACQDRLNEVLSGGADERVRLAQEIVQRAIERDGPGGGEA